MKRLATKAVLLVAMLTAMLTAMLMVGEAQAQSLYQGGAFTVRKVGKACKLEVALTPAKGKKGRAILSLFKGEKYYAELITERKAVGVAQSGLKIGFDKEKTKSYPMLKDAGMDKHWRWRYLEKTQGLLEEVKRRNAMSVNFSNGKDEFAFHVPLAGSGKAVQALEKCK